MSALYRCPACGKGYASKADADLCHRPASDDRKALDERYPTIARLADVSRSTVGYQGPDLVREAVAAYWQLAALQPGEAAQEAVAWMHDGYQSSPLREAASAQAAHLWVISDKVKRLWLAANPKHVEHYTIPLYAAPPSVPAAQGREAGDVGLRTVYGTVIDPRMTALEINGVLVPVAKIAALAAQGAAKP
jgi:hypothetical protein